MPVDDTATLKNKKLILDLTENEWVITIFLISATRRSSVMVGSVAMRHQITLILLLSMKLD
jgi:hypothetical protein